MNLTGRFSGPFAILMTPFRQDGRVDFDEMLHHVEELCASGIAGVIPCGSTGEFAQLSPDENMEIMTRVAEVVGGRKMLVFGATAGDHGTTRRYLEHAARLNADGALIAPPYYFPLNDDEVTAFYRIVAEENSGVPIVAYNIPQFTSPISLAVFERLLEMEHVGGMKNSSGNFVQTMHQLDLRIRSGRAFSLLTGSDETIFASLAAGCDGSFTAFGYLFPEILSYLYTHRHEPAAALACQMDLLPLLRIAGSLTFPFGYKLVGEARGFRFGEPRQAVPEAQRAYAETLRPRLSQMVGELYEKYAR